MDGPDAAGDESEADAVAVASPPPSAAFPRVLIGILTPSTNEFGGL